MNKITDCQRGCWGILAGLAAGAAVTLIVLGVLHKLRPLIAYTSSGGASALSLAFIALACRKSQHLEAKIAIADQEPVSAQSKNSDHNHEAGGSLPLSTENAINDSEDSSSDLFLDALDVFLERPPSPEVPVDPPPHEVPVDAPPKRRPERIESDVIVATKRFEDYLRMAKTQRQEAVAGIRALIESESFDQNGVIPQDPNNDSYLILLAKYGGPIEILDLFADANFNHVDRGGNTALHWACAKGHYEMASALLDTKKNNLKIHDGIYGGNTPLTIVLAQGYETTDSDGSPISISYKQLVANMVALDPEVIHTPNLSTGLYPVELALCHRAMDMVSLLTTDKVPINQLKKYAGLSRYQSYLILRSCFDVTGPLKKAWDWLPTLWKGDYENAQEAVNAYILQQSLGHIVKLSQQSQLTGT